MTGARSREPVYRCFCKATDREAGAPRHSGSWIAAKRAPFLVYDDGIRCGTWRIDAADVRAATLLTARPWLVPVRVLEVETDARTYQFGFNPWADVAPHLPFPFERRPARLKRSPLSVALRVLVAAGLLYLAWVALAR